MKITVLISSAPLLLGGCASSLETFDASGTQSVGVPIATPVLVKVTERTSFAVSPDGADYARYCIEEVNARYQFLAIGERSYVTFKPAPLGKGEFKLEFTDAGALKMVSLNSDASAGVEQVTGLIGSVLPYVAAPKPVPDARAAVSEVAAEKLKEKYCLKKGTEVLRVERVKIE
ncbi:hypothetical protein GPA27_26250 [Aromatoleum toluolicum]|uniref:Lipoprotein n=1 Tax=Aromatoleum toluolicum TaxID=90060 RepID=A0ABX1NNJ9_9RHOO|nr:hypothetical protein [Aromatoleum toluolicum]NMG00887.1 hypothetical protein [Aromatoleum toluolicum]